MILISALLSTILTVSVAAEPVDSRRPALAAVCPASLTSEAMVDQSQCTDDVDDEEDDDDDSDPTFQLLLDRAGGIIGRLRTGDIHFLVRT